jgi:4-hydroxythreonine-4-phosphate dehydrogenase
VFKKLGFEHPTIDVAALNPHVGEGGMFGTEEITDIAPAVKDAQALGIAARGPLSADAVFAMNLDGHSDCVLSMYHDQGHIGCKTLDFEKAVTITLGLPFMRSSVDHGTAFDLAGKGIAQGNSMIEATRVASLYAKMQLDYKEKVAAQQAQKESVLAAH